MWLEHTGGRVGVPGHTGFILFRLLIKINICLIVSVTI